ncbi:MAG: RNA-binding protein [Campylobacter sp.]|uniref:RNA recognition motif domain-containing protein n=1 Tax=Campylobacter TaxID=194 RepID=UPI000A33D488|nr:MULTISPECIES: RNA-binding protein [Campylobacter]MCR8690565.1 RNA-binding protein [Campylobacter sp. RM9264]MCR8701526.1 RNA-binding protein [Campylobacter sp. RM12176]MBE6430247.1 RNA-binding protein [Campylobacter sp.]MBO5064462.1 RNA-binding protein [Campylobacter sp.]MBQ3167341.1 RNA-binding protein [Campylobacter sp.]
MISNRICVNNKKDVTVLNIYVSNLPYRLSNEELRDIFAAYGEVSRVKIVKDKDTNRSKGFGFVEMPNDDEGKRAIAELNDKDVGGRALRVNEARPRE